MGKVSKMRSFNRSHVFRERHDSKLNMIRLILWRVLALFDTTRSYTYFRAIHTPQVQSYIQNLDTRATWAGTTGIRRLTFRVVLHDIVAVRRVQSMRVINYTPGIKRSGRV